MNKRLIIWVLALGMFYAGCGKVFNSKIPEDTFVSFYIDLTMAQDSLGKDPVVTGKILTELNKKYKVTPERYQNTLQYYSEDPDRWDAFFEKVSAAILKKRQNS